MGGTILKENILIENEEYYIRGDISAWETCLWRLRVHGIIINKGNGQRIKFDYENIDRTVRNLYTNSKFSKTKSYLLRTIGDLLIIRAIDPNYYSEDDPLKDPDLNIEQLFKED